MKVDQRVTTASNATANAPPAISATTNAPLVTIADNDRPLAVTMGDPAGIGLDITLAAWLARQTTPVPIFALYANANALAARARQLGVPVTIETITDPSAARAVFATALPVIDIELAADVIAGQPNAANALAVVQSIIAAVRDAHAGRIAAVVTNPIAKSVLHEAGFPHPGHTEFLGALAAKNWFSDETAQTAQPVMLLASDTLRVVPLTIHVPLALVPSLISQDLIYATARTLAAALTLDFGIAHPRIAVAGLNPHAGENGSIGLEDREIIAPAIARLQQDGMAITGPHSADTLFHAAARATYDAAIAMYHDQALIPIKTLAFDTGVNVTIGLPFVRTSPDHGTAFSLAGTRQANQSSLVEALRLAATMAARRSAAAAAASIGSAL